MRTSQSSTPEFLSDCRFQPLGLIAFVFCLLLTCGPVQGQNLQWGLSGGVTSGGFQGNASVFAGLSQIGTELPAEFDGRRTGFALGVNVRTELKRWLAARTAMNYVQQGGVVKRELIGPADGLVKETASYRFDYVTMPLLAEAHLPKRTVAGLRPSLYIGPELGVRLRSKAARNHRTVRGEQNFTTEVETSPAVLSMVSGAELAYPLPTGTEVALSLRYHYGLTGVTGAQGTGIRLGTIQAGLLIRYAR